MRVGSRRSCSMTKRTENREGASKKAPKARGVNEDLRLLEDRMWSDRLSPGAVRYLWALRQNSIHAARVVAAWPFSG
jgi:hypothetical protein